MYTQSAGQIRETFWKTLGQYLAPIPSASGEKINWINYKTGTKGVRFALEVENQIARVVVTVSDKEVLDKLVSLRTIFSTIAGKRWRWDENTITLQLNGKDIRRKDDWPDLISFFKEGLVALDAFWIEVRDVII